MVAYWGIAAHSTYYMISWYKCHFSFFPPLGLWIGNFFLIAPFPDHCLLVPLKLAKLRWTGHVKRMLVARLPKKVFERELQEGKRSQGGQKKRYKQLY